MVCRNIVGTMGSCLSRAWMVLFPVFENTTKAPERWCPEQWEDIAITRQKALRDHAHLVFCRGLTCIIRKMVLREVANVRSLRSPRIFPPENLRDRITRNTSRHRSRVNSLM